MPTYQVRNLDTGEVLHMSEIDDRVSLGTQPQSLRPLARPAVSRGWIYSVLGIDNTTVLYTACYLLPTTYYLLLTTHYSLLTLHHPLLTSHYSLLTTHYLLFITNTYYLLPITYYLLPTTYHRSPWKPA